MNIEQLQKVQIAEMTSSKGNQNKWFHKNQWYKADGLGYEALAEVLVSQLLQKTNVHNFVTYKYEKIQNGQSVQNGCVSDDFFLPGDEKVISVERLFQSYKSESAAKAILDFERTEDRIAYIVNQVTEMTSLHDFGGYIKKLLTIDALFLNEDRHFHNIAVIQKNDGTYRECPVFDNGAALFSDVRNDYPTDMPLEKCFLKVRAKPFSTDFDEQLDACDSLFGGYAFRAEFGIQDVEEILQSFEGIYDKAILERVYETMRMQIRKYEYLFTKQ